MSSQWSVVTEHPDFRRLLGGTSVSLLGSSLTAVALPLTAVSLLGASPVQMGLLGAAALVPNLALALPAGVWISRLAHRRVLVVVDLLRAVVLGAIPVLVLVGHLQMWHLYVAVLLAGTCTLFDAVTTESFLPRLVPRHRLLAANGIRALSSSTITTGGAALAGALVQVLTAPLVIAVDAVSFLLSALWKSRITSPGSPPVSRGRPREPITRQVLSGFRVVFGYPVIRSITTAATIGALAGQVQSVVLVLYLVRDLQLPATAVGAVIAVAGVGGVVGAVLAPKVTSRLGHGRTFIAGMLMTGLAGSVLAAAGGPLPLVLVVLVGGQLLAGTGPSLYGVTQQTVRQSLVPAELLSRALATWRLLVFGVQPVGALLGGVLGEALGLRWTLVAGSLLMLVATATSFMSPLRRLRSLPGARAS